MRANNQVPVLNGLVLVGGQSRRMGTDKASLRYGDDPRPQWKRMAEMLRKVCTGIFVSIRSGQQLDDFNPDDEFQILEDPPVSKGPLTGFLQAFATSPQSAWLVVACDLPLLDVQTLQHLVNHRGPHAAVAYRSAHDGLPEPMCAVYEPQMKTILTQALGDDLRCPRKILINQRDTIRLIDLPNADALENANTPEEFRRLADLLKGVTS